MLRLFAITIALGACQATIYGGDDGPNNNQVDGGQQQDIDASQALPDAAPVDTGPVCLATQARSVYLNFEGQALTRATTSDATQNQAAWMNKANGTAPAFRAGSGTRATDITQITNGITTALAGLNVNVVTTRPATGPYMMIVFGGTANNVGSNYGGAVQKLDCGNTVASDVAWVADAVTPNQRVINFALGAIGFGVGMTATNNTNDCMCGWDNACNQTTNQCTFGTAINTDPGANQTCPNQATQNEQQSIQQAFCQ
ncbi:MAG: hypothetical protein AB7T06_14175 [Kofleriaceae bacterium]